MNDDPVELLTARLQDLDDRDVGEHADILEAAHRTLIAELDALAIHRGTPETADTSETPA